MQIGSKAQKTQWFVLPKFPLYAEWYVSVEEAVSTAGTETCSFLVHFLCGILLILPQQDRQTQIAFTNAWRQPHKTWLAHQRLQLPGLGADELQDLSQALGGTSTTNYQVLKHSLMQSSSFSRWMHKSNALLETKNSLLQQQCAYYGMVKVRVKSPLRSPIYRVPDS
jgi:hypothetical protein